MYEPQPQTPLWCVFFRSQTTRYGTDEDQLDVHAEKQVCETVSLVPTHHTMILKGLLGSAGNISACDTFHREEMER